MNKVFNPVGCYIAVLIFNLTLGYLSVQYILVTFLGQTAHWLAALVGGLFLGQVSVPLALAIWILKSAGVSF